VYSSEAAAGVERYPEGCVEWERPYMGWFVLVCILTALLCGAIIWNWHQDFHSPESRNETNVTINASGFLSVSPEILDNGDTVRIINHSSGPVDAVGKTGDGRDLLVYRGLMPGENFYFECGEPCTIIVSAS
jgi:hypothetical protein